MKEKIAKYVVGPVLVTGFFTMCSIAGNLWASVIKMKIYDHAEKKAAKEAAAGKKQTA